MRRREGRYLLRSNLRHEDPATLWQYYIRLTEIEQAFKELKHDLAIRPIYHQTDKHIEAHIFIAFIAYCLHVTLKQHARSCAPGLTPRAVLEKFATMQMVDVHLPTTDGRQLVVPRYTQPDPDHQLLLQQLKLSLPAQPSEIPSCVLLSLYFNKLIFIHLTILSFDNSAPNTAQWLARRRSTPSLSD